MTELPERPVPAADPQKVDVGWLDGLSEITSRELPEHRASRQPDQKYVKIKVDTGETISWATSHQPYPQGVDVTPPSEVVVPVESLANHDRVVEARVRAEVAEEIARALEASAEPQDPFGFSREIKLADAARIVREHGSRQPDGGS